MAVKAKVDSYSVEIERLNKSIPLSREPERQRMMQRHSELCKQHKRLCSLKNRMGGINSEYHRKLDDQNKEGGKSVGLSKSPQCRAGIFRSPQSWNSGVER